MDACILPLFESRIEIDKFKKSIEQTQAFNICKELFDSRMSYVIFLDNNRSLKLSFRELNSLDLSSVPERIRKQKQRNFIKNLHNTIGSAFSFQDHLNYRNSHSLSPGKYLLSDFFRFLRNFLIHNDTFPLISKQIWNRGGSKRFESMDTDKFLQYLNVCLSKTEDLKKQIKIKELLNYIKTFSNSFDFEELYDQYFTYIFFCHHLWIKKKLYNKKILKEFVDKINEYDLKVEEYNNKIKELQKNENACILNNFSILSKEQFRYIKVIIQKKDWKNKQVLENLMREKGGID